MHSVEHILNATMVKTFGCPRSRTAHIEKKKSKCDYELSSCPTDEQIQAVEDKVNEVIKENNYPIQVEHSSLDGLNGFDGDMVITLIDVAEELDQKGIPQKIIGIRNIMDKKEIKEKLDSALQG